MAKSAQWGLAGVGFGCQDSMASLQCGKGQHWGPAGKRGVSYLGGEEGC